MIYLASPYSDPDPAVMQERFEQVTLVAGKLLASDKIVFAPITYGHPIAELGNGPTDAAAWQEFNYHMFDLSSAINVLCLKGWKASLGVTMELQWALQKGVPITLLNPSDYRP